jgi:hypothetical protein
MRSMLVFALLTVAGFLSTKGAIAQEYGAAHLQLVQYSAPPVPVMTMCFVNGVNYPVDYSGRIWGVNGYGVWFVIGRIVNNGYGAIAVRNDGLQFSATCN